MFRIRQWVAWVVLLLVCSLSGNYSANVQFSDNKSISFTLRCNMMYCDAIYEIYKRNTFSDKKFVSFHYLYQVHSFENENLPAAVQSILATNKKEKVQKIRKIAKI